MRQSCLLYTVVVGIPHVIRKRFSPVIPISHAVRNTSRSSVYGRLNMEMAFSDRRAYSRGSGLICCYSLVI